MPLIAFSGVYVLLTGLQMVLPQLLAKLLENQQFWCKKKVVLGMEPSHCTQALTSGTPRRINDLWFCILVIRIRQFPHWLFLENPSSVQSFSQMLWAGYYGSRVKYSYANLSAKISYFKGKLNCPEVGYFSTKIAQGCFTPFS